MRVAVLGTGGIGLATAALLCRHGHDPAIWSPSGQGTREFAEGAPLVASGAITGSFRPRVAVTCAQAMEGAECVIIAVPAYGHRAVMDAAVPSVQVSQTLIVSSQYSLSAMYLRQLLDRRGISVPIVAWGTTVVMGRRVGQAEVAVLTVRAAVDVATVPDTRAPAGLETCRVLFGDRFHPRANLIAIHLSNVNPQAHLANALCNLTRMEKGETWDNYGGLTTSVSRLVESLDKERLATAQAFGVKVRTMREHMSLSFDLPPMSLAGAARAVVQRGGSPGPSTLAARWILEDLPFGIVPQIALADSAGVEVPLHRAGLTLFSALLGRDLASENDLLPHLPIAKSTPEQLTQLST